MKPECKDIIKVILPAVRASVAEVMQKKYGYHQEEIAKKLGVVQVAVSKYLHRRYSKEISKVRDYISEHKLNSSVVESIINGGKRREIDNAIDELCDRLVAFGIPN
jgi:predicted transcriptional regulator